jgi:hypothetical protein
MKKILCVAICAISVIAAQAGSISGLNSGASVSNAAGALLDNTYMGQFYIGADAGSLTAVGAPVNFLAAGLLNAGVITANGTVSLQLKAWKGAATFEAASTTAGAEAGASGIISVTATDAPAPPASLSGAGLTGFALSTVTGGPVIPEPSTIALGLLGAAALFLRRRK